MKSDNRRHKWVATGAARIGALVLILCPARGGAGDFTPYEARTEFLASSPGSARAGLYGYVNPATLTYVDEMETVFTWSDETAIAGAANDWGWYTGLPHLGFGMTDRAVPGGGPGGPGSASSELGGCFGRRAGVPEAADPLEWLDISPLMSADETQRELNRFYQMPAAQPMPRALQLDLIDAGMMAELGGWAVVPGKGNVLT